MVAGGDDVDEVRHGRSTVMPSPAGVRSPDIPPMLGAVVSIEPWGSSSSHGSPGSIRSQCAPAPASAARHPRRDPLERTHMRTTVITPPTRFPLPHWRELWEAREVALRFGQRDVVLRYRQTAIGVAWVLIQPLAAAGIFSIVFGSRRAAADRRRPVLPVLVHQHARAGRCSAASSARSAPSLVAQPGARLEGLLPADAGAAVDRACRPARLRRRPRARRRAALVYGVNPGWARAAAAGLGAAVRAARPRHRPRMLRVDGPYRDVRTCCPG